MILLAIDTSGSGCHAAIHDSEKNITLGVAGEDIGRGHAERLMDFIDEALARACVDLGDIQRIAVTIGPGSFTGIRVGVAAARGLSLALGVPSVGVSTLAAIASGHLRSHPGAPVFVAIDAKRGEAYCQLFAEDGSAAGEPLILSLEEAGAAAAAGEVAVAGSAAPLIAGGEHAAAPGSDAIAAAAAPTIAVEAVDIETIARLGALADPAADRPKPIYLRGPDAKSQAGYAIARA